MTGFASTGAGAFGQGIAELGAGFFGFSFEMIDDVGVLSRDVRGFADVVDEIVQFGFFEFAIVVWDRCAAVSAGASAEGAIGVGKLKFPAAIASDDGLELVDFVVEPIGFVGIF